VSAAAAALTPTITGHACKVPAVKSLSAASKKPAKQLRATSSSSTAEEGPPAHQHASPQALHLSVSGCAAPGQRPKAAPDGAALALAGNGSACSPAADGGSSSSPAPFEPSGLLSTVWPAQYAACSSTTSIAEASAAAQLAARGILKRLRAQLRSRHGPPAFQRGPLPRPASPPPVVLTGVAQGWWAACLHGPCGTGLTACLLHLCCLPVQLSCCCSTATQVTHRRMC
jgi:hypothetical protein